jgi:hypothetical protein
VTITPTKTIIDIEQFNKSGSVDRIEDILLHLTGIDVMRGSVGVHAVIFMHVAGIYQSNATKYIESSKKYPESAKAMQKEGRVTVGFVLTL